MITTNVSGTTTILAILLNTTNAHASMGVSSWQPSFLAVRIVLWLFRDVPKTLSSLFPQCYFEVRRYKKYLTTPNYILCF